MKNALLHAICLLSVAGPLSFAQGDSKAVYKDPSAPIPARVSDLLSRMTDRKSVV